MKKELRIVYSGGRDLDLDHKIEVFAKSLGFEEWGRGYAFETQTRDFAFDKDA